MRKLILIAFITFLSNTVFCQSWSTVGSGVDGVVVCFAIYNGDLYVGGSFNNPGGLKYGLLKWDGSSFDTLPGTYLFGASTIRAMAVYNNELYVGGSFFPNNSSGPSIFSGIAKWDGSNFSSVGIGVDNIVSAMKVYNGNLYVGGDMLFADSTIANGIVKWDGIQWLSLNGGIHPYARVVRLEIFNNELYVAGGFSFQAVNSSCIARWNDVNWNGVGIGGIQGVVTALGLYNNELYAGGPYFTSAGGVGVNQIARWNGSDWFPVGLGIGNANNSTIGVLREFQGELFAGGNFKLMDGDSLNCIARYSGLAWNSVGTGVDSANIIIDTTFISPWDTMFIYAPHDINSLIEFNNELYAGGNFNMIGGITAHNIAKWSAPVGISEPQLTDELIIYPNPVINTINFAHNSEGSNITIEIFNNIGQRILYDPIFKSRSIDASGLTNGIYLMRYSNNSHSIQKSFVVNH